MLSNSKVQSDAFDVGRGDALKSAFGLSFLRLFVYEPMYTTVAPVIDWLSPAETLVAQIEGIQDERLREMTLMELEVMQGLYMFMQNTDAVERLMNGVRMHFMEPYTDPYAEREVIAQLEGIANGQRLSTAFTLDNETAVRVYGIGEISPQGAFDYGWIVEENTGDTVWSMEQGEWDHAGGAPRNRLADVVVRLPAGSYSLHYVSDDSHSYMSWNSTPPDHLYWGIRLLEEK
jgi:hypothetical protein